MRLLATTGQHHAAQRLRGTMPDPYTARRASRIGGMVDKRRAAAGDPPWKRYETSVKQMLAAIDPSATVLHNQRIPGQLSGIPRQVDVWAKGTLVGIEITVAVECKRHQRNVDVVTADQFIGKLLDIGADRGMLYSYSGFTNSATLRCNGAKNPSVIAIEMDSFESQLGHAGVANYGGPVEVEAVSIDDMDEHEFAQFLRSGEWPVWWG